MERFPPFFPKSRYLDKRSWHKVIWFFSAVFSFCSAYSAVFVILLILKINILMLGISSWLMVFPSVPLLWMIQHSSTSLKIVNNSPLSTFSLHNLGLVTVLGNPDSGLWLLVIYYIILIFVPSVLYRFILNQLLGKCWKGS